MSGPNLIHHMDAAHYLRSGLQAIEVDRNNPGPAFPDLAEARRITDMQFRLNEDPFDPINGLAWVEYFAMYENGVMDLDDWYAAEIFVRHAIYL